MPVAANNVDRSGWIEAARLVTPWSCQKMLRVMQDEGIPAWIDGAGYPSYPLKVPAEHHERATILLRQHGYDRFIKVNSPTNRMQ